MLDLNKKFKKVDCYKSFTFHYNVDNYLNLNDKVHLSDYTQIDEDNPLNFLNEEIKLRFSIDDEELNKVIEPDNLFSAFRKYVSGKGLLKKGSVQRYRANQIRNIIEIRKQVSTGKYKPDPTHEFKLNERGHMRYIKAPSVRDQVLQRSLNDNLIVPKTKKYIIYDNDASLKGRGISKQRKRFKIHLDEARRIYKKENNEGYILSIDFSKYFDNIIHSKAIEMFSKFLNKEQIELLKKLISEFEIDVSYMTDDEFALCESKLFNSLDYSKDIKNNQELNAKLNGSKMMKKSMGIGNQLSQITGVYYPTKIDNYCKKVKGIKFYGRYMDDTYIILRTKDEAKELLKDIISIANECGIHINMKKTNIKSIYNQSTFLKLNYFVPKDSSKRIIVKPVSTTFRRERRRIKKFKKLLDNGEMTFEQILSCYKSWRGTYSKYDCKEEIFALDREVREILHIPRNYDFSFNRNEFIKKKNREERIKKQLAKNEKRYKLIQNDYLKNASKV